jgi:hypothetical protein
MTTDWIFEPTDQLSQHQTSSWLTFLYQCRGDGLAPPLSQSLTWARGMEAVGAKTYLLFSPSAQIGGILHFYRDPLNSDASLICDCTNGPISRAILSQPNLRAIFPQKHAWSQRVAMDTLEFSQALLSRLPEGVTISVSPRLLAQLDQEAKTECYTTTQLNLKTSLDTLFSGFHPRLKRTLRSLKRMGVQVRRDIPSQENLETVYPFFIETARRKGFSIPPLPFFKALAVPSKISIQEKIRHWLYRSEWSKGHPEDRMRLHQAAILCVEIEDVGCHYLFGGEARAPNCPSKSRPGALLHWEAIHHAQANQLAYYDFNGHQANLQPESPYASVAQFKNQWNGELIQYWTYRNSMRVSDQPQTPLSNY